MHLFGCLSDLSKLPKTHHFWGQGPHWRVSQPEAASRGGQMLARGLSSWSSLDAAEVASHSQSQGSSVCPES